MEGDLAQPNVSAVWVFCQNVANNRLTRLRPSLRRDLIDHRNILILSLFSEGRTINIMNVYSDDQHTTINLLAERAPTLPACVLMTGDFNCHSREWDPLVPHHQTTAILLLDTAARLGLELTLPVNPRPTFLSHNVELWGSVIDLVFIKASESLVQPRRLLEWQGPSDHIPLASKFSLPSELEDFKRVFIAKGSDAETQFVEQLIRGIQGIRLETPTTIAEVDAMAQAVADVFSKAWLGQTMPQRSESPLDLSHVGMTHAWRPSSSTGMIKHLRIGAPSAKPLELRSASSLIQRSRRLLKPTDALGTWWNGSKDESFVYFTVPHRVQVECEGVLVLLVEYVGVLLYLTRY